VSVGVCDGVAVDVVVLPAVPVAVGVKVFDAVGVAHFQLLPH